jgi:hypothetical protein
MKVFIKKISLFICLVVLAFQLPIITPAVADITPTLTPTSTPTQTPTSTLTPTQNPTPTLNGACNDAAPAAPTLISADSAGPHSVVLKWGGVTDSVSYYLVSYGTAAENYIYGNPNVGNVTTYTVGSLSTGKTYYFAVKAVNGCTPGAYSNEISGVPGSSTPTPTVFVGEGEISPTGELSPTENLTPTQSAPITPVPRPGAVNVEKVAVYSVIGVLLLLSVIVLIVVNRSGQKPGKPQSSATPFEPPTFDSDQSKTFDEPQDQPPINTIS